ncbi:hypothetical protein FH972_025451 [Carpinus fangiana]|uniref:Uncharacterized protein n=1 Tax=Carpinus fangiana TaxID=176857 RepID=A0A5N6L122_9ROSI|nr:hypothetical protein FH972_025451 [Carpinus fangiana]
MAAATPQDIPRSHRNSFSGGMQGRRPQDYSASYGSPPQHNQVTNLQAEYGVAPPPAQAYAYGTSPPYSPGAQSSYTPTGPVPVPSPYQQAFGPYSGSPSQRPAYPNQGSGYFPQQQPQPQPQRPPYGPYTDANPNAAPNLHPAHAADGGYPTRPANYSRHGSHSSTHSQNARRHSRKSSGSHDQDRASAAAQARRASYQYEQAPHRRHRHGEDYSDDDSAAYSDDEEEEYDDRRRRHSYAGTPSAYSQGARKRRGSHRSEAEIQADKDAIDRRPTLADSLVLMYDTFKGAISGKR